MCLTMFLFLCLPLVLHHTVWCIAHKNVSAIYVRRSIYVIAHGSFLQETFLCNNTETIILVILDALLSL